MLVELLDARNEVTLPGGRYKTDPNALLGIAVHHSVSWYATINPASLPYPHASEADERKHIREIDALHVSEGYGCFGYHTIAFPSGRLYQTGDFDGARAHVAGRNNVILGVCMVGRFDSGFQYPPGDAQLKALASGLRYLTDYTLPRKTVSGGWDIKGHNDWSLPGNGTACAGLLNNIGDWYAHAETLIAEPAPIPPGNQPVLLPVDLQGPNGTLIRLEARGIRFFVSGVNVFNIGDFEEGSYPGQISKLYGPAFQWLRNNSGAAYWSPDKGD